MDPLAAHRAREAQVAALVGSVQRALGGSVPEDAVEREVRRELELLDGARIRVTPRSPKRKSTRR